MNIPQEIKDEVIRLTKETTMTVKAILKYISKHFDLHLEDYYSILDEYEKQTKTKIVRGMDKSKLKENISDDLLVELCKNGYSYDDITAYLIEKRYTFKCTEIRKKVKDIYARYGLKKKAKKPVRKKPLISEEELIYLHSQGKTYSQISQYYESKNIKISPKNLQRLLSEIYKKRGQKIPKIIRKVEKTINPKKKRINREQYGKIYELRQEEKSYEEIVMYFVSLGYSVSSAYISKLCKQIYAEKGETEPILKRQKAKISMETLIEMRKKGLRPYQVIEYFKNKGIKISEKYLRHKYCLARKRINDDERDETLIQKGKRLAIVISDGELEKLRNRGMSYEKIKKHFESKDIEVSVSYIKNRVKRIEARRSVDIRIMPEKKLNAILFNLKQTKGATDEQLRQLAAYYGYTYDSSYEERTNPYIVKKIDEER